MFLLGNKFDLQTVFTSKAATESQSTHQIYFLMSFDTSLHLQSLYSGSSPVCKVECFHEPLFSTEKTAEKQNDVSLQS